MHEDVGGCKGEIVGELGQSLRKKGDCGSFLKQSVCDLGVYLSSVFCLILVVLTILMVGTLAFERARSLYAGRHGGGYEDSLAWRPEWGKALNALLRRMYIFHFSIIFNPLSMNHHESNY